MSAKPRNASGLQDAADLGLAGDTVDVRGEDEADTDAGADRGEARNDERSHPREGLRVRGSSNDHEVYRFPFEVGWYLSTRHGG